MISDQFIRLRTRYYQRLALATITYQPLLRWIFEADAWLAYKRTDGVTLQDMTIAGVSGLRIRPDGLADDAPKLLYFHGGGFTIGSPWTHRWMVARIAKAAGIEAFLPNYRKAPEHPFPAAQEDALAVARAYAPDCVAGDSAGGCLSLTLVDQIDLRAMVLLSPLADQSDFQNADFSSEHLIPKRWARALARAVKPVPADTRASPLLGDLSNAPPTLIQVGDQEVLRPQADRLAKAIPNATLTLYPAMPHVWQLYAGKNATADRAVQEMATFLKAQL